MYSLYNSHSNILYVSTAILIFMKNVNVITMFFIKEIIWNPLKLSLYDINLLNPFYEAPTQNELPLI